MDFWQLTENTNKFSLKMLLQVTRHIIFNLPWLYFCHSAPLCFSEQKLDKIHMLLG